MPYKTKTEITLRSETKEKLDELRGETPWDEFLSEMVDYIYREVRSGRLRPAE